MGWDIIMPVPHKLLQDAFATLSEPTLRKAAKHNGIRGHKTLPVQELAQRLGEDEGTHLLSYSHYLTAPELEGVAQVFGLELTQLSKEELKNEVFSFIEDYDRNQKYGRVVTVDDALNRPTDYEQFRAVRELIERKLVKPSGYCSGPPFLDRGDR